jgi:hypothetical protein
MAGVEGFEPPALGFGDRCSGQLSYTPICVTGVIITVFREEITSYIFDTGGGSIAPGVCLSVVLDVVRSVFDQDEFGPEVP